jgi:hypothetical protein
LLNRFGEREQQKSTDSLRKRRVREGAGAGAEKEDLETE